MREKYGLNNAVFAAGDIERILSGEPLDYVIGWAPFLRATIDLSLRPFIPRPETEYWTAKAVEYIKKARGKKSLSCLDMFAGSGAIGIAVLAAIPKARVVFGEKNRRFLEEIRLNLRKNKISGARARVVRSDIFSNVRGKFDVILANPPYVGDVHHLDSKVARYEPKEAYWGGRNGLVFIKRFLESAGSFLKLGGTIWMEHGSWQKNEVAKLLKKLGYRDFSFHNDQYGRARYVVIRA